MQNWLYLPQLDTEEINLDLCYIDHEMVRGLSTFERDFLMPQKNVLIERHNAYSRAGLWPAGAEALNTSGWLSNFRSGEDQAIACALLDSFLFFSESVTKKLFLSAFHSLSSKIEKIGDSMVHDGQQWVEFLRDKVLISYPTDTNNETTGSGPKYATLIRDSTSISADNILSPEMLTRRVKTSREAPSIVIVDDFAGSGNQFIKTWERKVPYGIPGDYVSLRELSEAGNIDSVFYVVAVATEKATQNIFQEAPNIQIVSSYLLDNSYSLSNERCNLIPEEFRELLPSFLERYTQLAGHPENYIFGYESCGYAIGFESSIPDNNLAILQRGISENWISLRGEY